MRPGQGNGAFIADLHLNVPDPVMRERWRAGAYDQPDGRKPRAEYVAGWRRLAGRM
jgi:hypothetical protein